MTTDLAAALLADVPRYRPEHPGVMVPDINGVWVDHRHVLAALSRALDPALAERVGEVVARLREGMPEAFDATEGYAPSVSLAEERMADAADLLTALLTANAALRAERDAAYAKGFSDAEAEISATAIGQQNAALHKQLARAKVERDALRAERDASNEIGRAFEEDAGQQRARAERLEAAIRELKRCWYQGDLTENDFRAALTETATTEERK